MVESLYILYLSPVIHADFLNLNGRHLAESGGDYLSDQRIGVQGQHCRYSPPPYSAGSGVDAAAVFLQKLPYAAKVCYKC